MFFAPVYWMMNKIYDIEDLPKRFVVLCSINCTPGLTLMFFPIEVMPWTSLGIASILFYLVAGQWRFVKRLIEEQELVDKLRGR